MVRHRARMIEGGVGVVAVHGQVNDHVAPVARRGRRARRIHEGRLCRDEDALAQRELQDHLDRRGRVDPDGDCFPRLPKPGRLARTTYRPGGSAGSRYVPSFAVMTTRRPCRLTPTAPTVTPGNGAPRESEIQPAMPPVVWAAPRAAHSDPAAKRERQAPSHDQPSSVSQASGTGPVELPAAKSFVGRTPMTNSPSARGRGQGPCGTRDEAGRLTAIPRSGRDSRSR